MAEYLVSDGFKTAGGTGVPTDVSKHEPPVEAVSSAPTEDSPIARWLRSDEAQRYQGLWVLLTPDLDPQDNDLSPTALKDRNPGLPDGYVIVFVRATTVQLGV